MVMHEEITLLAISTPCCVSTSHSNQPVFSLKIFAQPHVCSDGRAVLMRRQSIARRRQSKSKARKAEAKGYRSVEKFDTDSM